MIEMGIIAGQRLEDIKKVGIFLTSFAIIMPTINGIIGVLVSTALGLSLAGQLCLEYFWLVHHLLRHPLFYVMQFLKQIHVYTSHQI